MFKNYLKIVWRNVLKHKLYSIINILGLAIGMAVCMIIMQYVAYEKSYDKFHENYENIYRVKFNIYKHGQLKVECAAAVPAVGPAMKDNFPEVLEYCRAFPASGIMSNGEISFREERLQVVSPSFLTMLTFPMIIGDPESALDGPYKTVITESTARKYFGDDDPLGKTVTWDGEIDFEITGVCRDVPDNSHIKFSFLISHDTIREFWGEEVDTAWGWYDFNTYVLLEYATDYKHFNKKFDEWLLKEKGKDWEKREVRFEFPLQPLTSIHLYSNLLQESEPAENGDGTAVKFLFIISLFILLIAWVNFINLSTSRAVERSKEIGIRKVSGADRKELISQFLQESFIVNIIALIMAFILVYLSTPFFRDLTGSQMKPDFLVSSGLWLWLLLIFIVGSFLSGLYPAFVLSAFKPVLVLKGDNCKGIQGNLLRKILVVFQFVVSVILIAGLIIVFNQLRFLRSQNLGIDIEQTLVIKGPGIFSDESLKNIAMDSFKQEIDNLPVINSLSVSTNVPGVEIFWGQGSFSEDQTPEDAEVMYLVGIDQNFISNFGLKLLAGSNFTTDLAGNMKEAIVNHSAVKRYGYAKPEDIIDKKIFISRDTLLVKGVIENFNQMSLKSDIIPLAFPLIKEFNSDAFFSMKIANTGIKETINQVKDIWDHLFPGNPFDYFFLDEHFDNQYRKDIQFGVVFGIFTGLAIFIACLGLFALTSYSATQRTKEIGIRKVMGASVNNILKLLVFDFLGLIILSMLIALPIVYLVMDSWLNNFAYRISISGWTFLTTCVIVILITLITIAYQTIRTALSNPAEALKYE